MIKSTLEVAYDSYLQTILLFNSELKLYGTGPTEFIRLPDTWPGTVKSQMHRSSGVTEEFVEKYIFEVAQCKHYGRLPSVQEVADRAREEADRAKAQAEEGARRSLRRRKVSLKKTEKLKHLRNFNRILEHHVSQFPKEKRQRQI